MTPLIPYPPASPAQIDLLEQIATSRAEVHSVTGTLAMIVHKEEEARRSRSMGPVAVGVVVRGTVMTPELLQTMLAEYADTGIARTWIDGAETVPTASDTSADLAAR